MSVLHVANSALTRGAEVAMARYVTTLSEKGQRVLAAFPEPGPISHDLANRGIPVSTYGDGKIPLVDSIRKLLDVIRSRNVEIVHTHGSRAELLCRVCRFMLRDIRLVSSAHRIRRGWATRQYAQDSVRNQARRQLHARFYGMLERCSRPLTDVFIAHSNAIATDLREQGIPPGRVLTLAHGLSEEWLGEELTASGTLRKLLPGQMQTGLLIGLVGAIEPEKGQQILLEAMPMILGEYPEVACLFVGPVTSPSYQRRLAAQITRQGIQGRVAFAGEVADMRSAYQDLNILVQASYTEGFPLIVMEGMATGRPIVATDVGGTSELIRDGVTGLLVAPGDAPAIAAAVCRLIAEPEKRAKLSFSASEHARRHFRMAPVMCKLEQVYRDLISGRLQAQRRF